MMGLSQEWRYTNTLKKITIEVSDNKNDEATMSCKSDLDDTETCFKLLQCASVYGKKSNIGFEELLLEFLRNDQVIDWEQNK